VTLRHSCPWNDPLAMIIHDQSDVVKAHRWSFVLQEAVSD